MHVESNKQEAAVTTKHNTAGETAQKRPKKKNNPTDPGVQHRQRTGHAKRGELQADRGQHAQNGVEHAFAETYKTAGTTRGYHAQSSSFSGVELASTSRGRPVVQKKRRPRSAHRDAAVQAPKTRRRREVTRVR
jgi:hypothetical protein